MYLCVRVGRGLVISHHKQLAFYEMSTKVPMALFCGHGKEPSGSIKGGKISWLYDLLSASQEGLWTVELFRYPTL
jgi:hypothetical protein